MPGNTASLRPGPGGSRPRGDRASDRGIATADADGLPCDPGGQIRGEERHQRRDVVGPPQALDWVGLENLLAVRLPEAPVGVARLDPAECDRVHRDAGASKLARERAREAQDAPPRCRRDAELRLADA